MQIHSYGNIDAKELLKLLRKSWKGVYVMTGIEKINSVNVVKSDLMFSLSQNPDATINVTVIDGRLYIDKA